MLVRCSTHYRSLGLTSQSEMFSSLIPIMKCTQLIRPVTYPVSCWRLQPLSPISKPPAMLQDWRLFWFANFVSISDQKVNISDDVETCQTFTWDTTLFKVWTNLKYNKLNIKVKDRVEWKRLCNWRHNP